MNACLSRIVGPRRRATTVLTSAQCEPRALHALSVPELRHLVVSMGATRGLMRTRPVGVSGDPKRPAEDLEPL